MHKGAGAGAQAEQSKARGGLRFGKTEKDAPLLHAGGRKVDGEG